MVTEALANMLAETVYRPSVLLEWDDDIGGYVACVQIPDLSDPDNCEEFQSGPFDTLEDAFAAVREYIRVDIASGFRPEA